MTIGARNSREKPSRITSRASSFRLRRVVTSGGVSRTTKATDSAAKIASPAQAMKPARQPLYSTRKASGLAEITMPVLPTA